MNVNFCADKITCCEVLRVPIERLLDSGENYPSESLLLVLIFKFGFKSSI